MEFFSKILSLVRLVFRRIHIPNCTVVSQLLFCRGGCAGVESRALYMLLPSHTPQALLSWLCCDYKSSKMVETPVFTLIICLGLLTPGHTYVGCEFRSLTWARDMLGVDGSTWLPWNMSRVFVISLNRRLGSSSGFQLYLDYSVPTSQFFCFFYFFCRYWCLNSGPHNCRKVLYHLSHSISTFSALGFFQDRVSWTICLDWL
jgi:hypothetical protein